MTDKELHRLRRGELLDIMVQQQQQIERLSADLKQARLQLEDRDSRLTQLRGIVASAASVTQVLKQASEGFIEEVSRLCEEGTGLCALPPVSEQKPADGTPKAREASAKEKVK